LFIVSNGPSLKLCICEEYYVIILPSSGNRMTFTVDLPDIIKGGISNTAVPI